MIHFGLIFLTLFLLLLVVMDYQEKKDLKRSLKYAGIIVGVASVILIVYHFLQFGVWAIAAISIIAALIISGYFVRKKKPQKGDIID